tara:strand:+ start:1487 stop:1645 length:159 start_codon:yes stop_codon:yes gene_type:complete
MREVSIFTLWTAIKDLVKSIYQWLLDDQKRMDELKKEYIKRQQEKDDEILGI